MPLIFTDGLYSIVYELKKYHGLLVFLVVLEHLHLVVAVLPLLHVHVAEDHAVQVFAELVDRGLILEAGLRVHEAAALQLQLDRLRHVG